ncbi:type I-F CRISPR-associated protein Csy2 [Pseudomonas frederiksbergensis]|uniref:type I-F CRISPR-associated protein Csy2 n=1 Tax=Pseudomonas frederiksbergensis TaxID=104087 RepID=UPI003D1ACDE6
MSYYLVICNLKVKHANALSSNYTINAAPVMAINLFAHNLGLRSKSEALGVAIIHHDAQLLGEHDDSFKSFVPHQRRSATYIDGNDYSRRTQTLSLQSTASVHLTLSVIIEMKRRPELDKIRETLQTGRLAGGRIEQFSDPLCFEENDESVFNAIPRSGFWLIERQDLMLADKNPVKALVSALGQKPKKASGDEDASVELSNGWLVPTVLGYAATSKFEKRTGVRMLTDDNSFPLHAFAEPLLGLAQYVSLRTYSAEDFPFWRTSWIESDVFVTHCSV